jgi:hypothetical protein
MMRAALGRPPRPPPPPAPPHPPPARLNPLNNARRAGRAVPHVLDPSRPTPLAALRPRRG